MKLYVAAPVAMPPLNTDVSAAVCLSLYDNNYTDSGWNPMPNEVPLGLSAMPLASPQAVLVQRTHGKFKAWGDRHVSSVSKSFGV